MAEIEVEMPDGTILAFPEGMDPQAMQQAAAKFWSERSGGSINSAIDAPTPQTTAQQQLDEGLIPSGDADTRSTAEYNGQKERGAGFNQAATLAGPMLDTAGAAWRGVTGEGPSVVGSMLERGVNLGYGDPVQVGPRTANALGRVGDFGLTVLSGIGGVASGAAGAVGDIAEDLGVPGAERLGRELAAIPEAFAGSPTQFSGMLPRAARAVPDAPAPRPSGPWDNPTPAGSTIRRETRQSTPNQLGRDVQRASGGSGPARQRVAEQVQIDTDAQQAAERLNMDLPADVLSNNQLIRESAGLTRSLAGTQASANWRDVIVNAADRAMEAMQRLGGSTDLSNVSDEVLNRLRGTQANLLQQSDKLYDAVDAQVQPGTVIQPTNTVRTLNEIVRELGNGTDGMTAAERNLFRLATSDQPVTYERLMREKRQIQKALRSGQGAYADADDRMLRRIESALVQDQLENVGEIGGEALRGNLELANRLTAQRKQLEQQIVGAFGRDGEGSIASQLRTAITSAARGDIGRLNRTLNVIPQDLRREAIATAITALSQSRRATEPGFGFAEFAKVYEGLQSNRAAYSRIINAIGPEADQTLRDLASISRRITDARANVLTTGKANQALLEGMTAEGLVAKVLQTSLGRNAVRLTTATGGGAVGGPAGSMAGVSMGETIMAAVSNRGANQLQQAGEMFNSPEFRQLAVKAATGQATEQAQKAVLQSSAFRRWAQAAKIENPAVWLQGALVAASASQSETEQAEP